MAGRRLYVGNLPFEIGEEQPISESHLIGLFEEYGKVIDVIVMRFRETGRCRGFGFVEFAKAGDALMALALDGMEFHGRPLIVEFAGPRSEMRPCARSSD